MAVEQQESAERQIVQFTWDKEIVTGEVVQLHCVNPENGDVSVSGFSRNDGLGYVTYPLGYSGTSQITVYDNDGNQDKGFVAAGDASVTPPEPPIDVPPPDTGEPPVEGEEPHPEHPIVLPPEDEIPDHIWGPPDGRPTPPIVIFPDPGDDFWTGNLPPFEHPQPIDE